MSFRDDLVTILSGGLPALLDGDPRSDPPAAGGAEGSPVTPQRTEEIPPTGTFRDTEPFLLSPSLNAKNILLGTAAVVGLIAVVMIARR